MVLKDVSKTLSAVFVIMYSESLDLIHLEFGAGGKLVREINELNSKYVIRREWRVS